MMTTIPIRSGCATAGTASAPLDRPRRGAYSYAMQILTADEAKEQFAKVGRRVVTRKQAVVVKFPFGFMKCEPWEMPEEVAPVAKGTLRRSKREIALGNSLGETL